MRIVTMCALALTMVACGSEEPPPDRERANQADEERAPTVGAELARDLKDPLDRAKNVENQVLEQKQKIDAALREAEADPNRR